MNKADFHEVVKCKHCGNYDYFGEMRWKGGRQLCRRCYKTDWEHRHGGTVYPWNDLDAAPFPSDTEIGLIENG